MKYYINALKNYAKFKGRASLSEYWYFVLFQIIFVIVAIVLDNILGLNFKGVFFGFIYLFYCLATALPGISIAVRRLHDLDKTGWWFLIVLIPTFLSNLLKILFGTESWYLMISIVVSIIGLICSIGFLVLLASGGTIEENKYGSNPNKVEVLNEDVVIQEE